MATQITSGGPPALINAVGMTTVPAGTTAPAKPMTFNLWQNGVEIVPDTPFNSPAPAVLADGLSLKIFQGNGAITAANLQLAAGATLPPATGYHLLINGGVGWATVFQIDFDII